jgi:RNA polymerase sigma factor (sigma-70 family)
VIFGSLPCSEGDERLRASRVARPGEADELQGKPRLKALAGSALRAQPDRRLVRLAREGHDAAMAEIVRRYRPALVGYAARIVPPHRAEDVVQESLSRAMIALVEDEREIKLKPWLYAIVRNRALNDLRDERPHEPIPDDFDGVRLPQEVAERREEVASLVAAIGALPDGQRDAIVQRELEGRSHEEIAARLGSTPGAVRGLIFRARLTLRDAIGALVPLPLVRWLLGEASGVEAATGAGGAAAAGGIAAAGAAGGGGVAAKSGVALVVATLALGSGAAMRDDGKRSAAQASDRSVAQQEESSRASSAGEGSGTGPGASPNSGPSSNSAPGGGDDDGGEDNSGPGGGDREDNSGPGSGGDEGDGDNSGPGGGGGPEPEREDHSGPGGGGSASGSSGSGSRGSCSGTSGSGGGDPDAD